ncbi:MAG TPA: hypothetical protein VGK06_00470 [Methanosarcina sp.]|jgi:hypothetical protein
MSMVSLKRGSFIQGAMEGYICGFVKKARILLLLKEVQALNRLKKCRCIQKDVS